MEIEENIAVSKFDKGVQKYRDDCNYILLWMKNGFKYIHIDFESFSVQSNSIYFIVPGRRVKLFYNSQPEGWLLKFSREFFKEQVSPTMAIKDADIFSSFGDIPKIILSPEIGNRVHTIAEMIDELIGSQIPNRESGIGSLLKTLLIYCDSNCNIKITEEKNTSQIQIITLFKDLVNDNYQTIHKVSEYAAIMNISLKYLNEVINNLLGMSAKAYVQEQLTIRARRELKFSDDNVKEIAYRLGFCEPSHFSSYFKKQTGYSPSQYRVLQL
jgi:AraC-like DNA-binding protein